MRAVFSVRGSPYAAFALTIDQEMLQAGYSGDVASLTFQATLERMSSWDMQLGGATPILLSLHGALYREQMYRYTGVALLPPDSLPLNIPKVGDMLTLRLPFTCSRRYIEYLEDERATQPGRDLALAVRLWGVVAVMQGQAGVEGDTTAAPVRFENVESTSPETLRIPRSDWIDQLLPALGYRKTILIELPLAGRPEVPEELRDAILHLDEARVLRNHESYRKAVHTCRQAIDALLGEGKGKVTWCQTHLAPVIGPEKATMVDDSLRALRPLLTDASHGNNTVEIDRDAADYVIESLALALNYIARKLA